MANSVIVPYTCCKESEQVVKLWIYQNPFLSGWITEWTLQNIFCTTQLYHYTYEHLLWILKLLYFNRNVSLEMTVYRFTIFAFFICIPGLPDSVPYVAILLYPILGKFRSCFIISVYEDEPKCHPSCMYHIPNILNAWRTIGLTVVVCSRGKQSIKCIAWLLKVCT